MEPQTARPQGGLDHAAHLPAPLAAQQGGLEFSEPRQRRFVRESSAVQQRFFAAKPLAVESRSLTMPATSAGRLHVQADRLTMDGYGK
ncbi:MAG: hypothetical protein ACKV22_02765 [Bryobacteraceae bacterium]